MSPSLNRIALSLAVTALFVAGGTGGAEAQRVPSKAPAAKAAPATNDTDRALDGAAKALESGNADAAMTALDGVLSGGGLSNPHMARALYLRGLAHRAKGRQAQAIADFTSAVWLKDGLNEKDRTAALNARSETSREVGVAAPGAQPDAAGSGSSQRTRVASAPRTSDDYPSDTGSSSSGSFGLQGLASLFSSSPSPAPPPPPPPAREASPSPAAGPATSSWQSSTTVESKERRRAPAEQQVAAVSDAAPPPPSASPSPPPAPANRPAADAPKSGGGLGSFFTGLFTGGSGVTSAPQNDAGGSSQWRPRTDRAPAAPETPVEARAKAAAETRTAKVAPPKSAKDSAPISTSAVANGSYRLQIATVRSRKEADALAAKVRQDHAGVIGNRRIEVDETVFGGMGKFYRVRLGPYADVREPKSFCEQLRPQGYDCLVVTN